MSGGVTVRTGHAATAAALLSTLCALALAQAFEGRAGTPFEQAPDATGPGVTQPLAFVPNRGQVDRRVRYEARGAGFGFYFTRRKVTLAFAKGGSRHVLDLRFIGSARDLTVDGGTRLPGTVSHIHGRDRSKWQRGLPTYGELRYNEVWPGVDVVFRGTAGMLKYEFVVDPGASPAGIRLAYGGARRLSLTRAGAMRVHTRGGSITDSRPQSFQRVDGRRIPVSSSYSLGDTTTSYGFTVGTYDRRRPLVIDPGLEYSTFLGGVDDEIAADVDVDAAGNAYVMGGTQSPDYPSTPGAYDPDYGQGAIDFFITKLDPSGSRVLYSTFLGGSGFDSTLHTHRGALDADADGNVYLTGSTLSSDFPTTPGAFDTTYNGTFRRDAVVAKLNRAGSDLVYSTFLGGADLDEGLDLAVDGSGSAFVTGFTRSLFPTTPRAFDTQPNGFSENAFVTKLNPAGSDLVYSTLLQGTAFRSDRGEGIAVDSRGSAYVAGSTQGGFPTTPGAHDREHGGEAGDDGFVTKLDTTGSELLYSTYLGGGGSDRATGIDVGAGGNAYVTGSTLSADFPTTPQAFDSALGATDSLDADAFVTKVDPHGASLLYSTYLGGSDTEEAHEIAIDRHGSAYVAGFTDSQTFPSTAGAFDPTYNGPFGPLGGDGYMTQLDPAGSALLHSTFLGGGSDDGANAVALGAAGGVYVAGHTESPAFPTTPGAYDREFEGGDTDTWAANLAVDRDGDGVGDPADNCPETFDPDQRDTDGDGIGDECDADPGNTPCRVIANGKLASNPKARFALHASFREGDRAPRGRISYADGAIPLDFRSLSLSSLIVHGTHASIRGRGRFDGETGDFRVDLDDLGRPGRLDRFEIRLASGYTAAGALRNGDVSIDCR